VAVLAHNIWGYVPMASAVARAYNEGFGTEHPAGSKCRAPAQGVRGASPEAEALLVFWRSIEAANLPNYLQFGNAKKSDICVIFAKKLWVATKTGGGAGLKPPLLGAAVYEWIKAVCAVEVASSRAAPSLYQSLKCGLYSFCSLLCIRLSAAAAYCFFTALDN